MSNPLKVKIHTAKVAEEGKHVWHAWISERPEVGIGATETEAIEHLAKIHEDIVCGFCGQNLAECDCPYQL